jgi:hypothetical protein
MEAELEKQPPPSSSLSVVVGAAAVGVLPVGAAAGLARRSVDWDKDAYRAGAVNRSQRGRHA